MSTTTMSSKPKAKTRASSRTKTPTPAPTATRTTRARTVAKKPATEILPLAEEKTAKKSTARKPLVNRDNAVDVLVPSAPTKSAPKAANVRKAAKGKAPSDTDREPIMAYLRIRPYLGSDQPSALPYLVPLSDTSVRMTDPDFQFNNPSRFRPSTLPPSSIYTFSHIFPPHTTQSDFFSKTTLPLVRDVLTGQNALLFTYGVTNSGKTYTVQGGGKQGSAGILPRTLDVMFNSIEGMHGDGRYRPIRLQGVELADPTDSNPPQLTPEPALAHVLGQHLDQPPVSDIDIDPTILKLDRNYEYTIWLSYAEVYNEKVYDLLASVKDDSDSNTNGNGNINPRSAGANSLLLSRKALPLKPVPPSDSTDSPTPGKYVSGLRQFRVHSASQAKALVKLGQLHRRVFGTLANRESSRSHGIVILKVVRGHKGERNDPTALQISRLTLVDLAGSERTKHTHTTGDRLKEAGNINKSLMVLGQCMEVMRTNQRKVAASLAQEGAGAGGRMDTRDVKKGLAVVPFRHSKLTEVLMDYFVGDGRAVMIVNVNPYDTGYDENSHVMKFAALAREVYITPTSAPVRIPPAPGPGKTHGKQIRDLGPMTLRDPEIAPLPYRRKVTIETPVGGGRRASQAVLEVFEEDEGDEGGEGDGDDEPINPLVDALFDEVEELRVQLFESEMRCAIIEAETREEVMREMEERMRNVEKMYTRRLMNEVVQNELKTDAKIDMLHQSGLFGSPTKKELCQSASDISEEQDVEMSLVEYGEDDETEADFVASGEEFVFESDGDSASEQSRSISKSPLAGKGKGRATPPKKNRTALSEIREYIPDGPEAIILPSDDEDAELTETDEGEESGAETRTTESEVDEDEYDDDEEDWVPSMLRTPRPKANLKAQRPPSPLPVPQVKGRQPAQKPSANNTCLSNLERELSDLSLGGAVADDSVIILPIKKFNPRQDSVGSEEDEEVEVSALKKKKRQLGKKPIVTEEQIERVALAVKRHGTKGETGRNIRRIAGR